jgi:hypothetical protein
MPDLPSIHHVKQVVILSPKISEPAFHKPGLHWTIENGYKRITAIELAVIIGMLQYLFEEVIHKRLVYI